MKILLIISETPPVRSGIARVAEKLSQGLARRGFTIDTLSLDEVPRWEYGEIRISTMPWKLGALKSRLASYDIIHLHGPVPTFSDVFLLMGLRDIHSRRPKLVYTHHAPIDLGIPILRPFTNLYNLAQEWLARIADHVVVSTPSYVQRLSRYVPAGKLSTIPWGVDFDRFYAPVNKGGVFTVLYLGQVRPYKGLPVLLKAARGLEGMRLWVVGDGHYADTCKRQAREAGMDNVTFWGSVPDAEMIELVKRSHAVVLPSVTRSEAFGIALLEGMAAGLVPIASHLPGVADVVGNEGITFQPGNTEALRQALIRLRNDAALRTHLASLAQAKARLYSWERCIFGYERIFHKLVSDTVPLPRTVQPDTREVYL